MKTFVRTNALRPVMAALLLAACQDVRAEDASQNESQNTAQAEQQVLVLRDGGVLTGRISREGDRYLLKRSGAEMQVAAGNVILVADSLDDAYQQRRQLNAGADSHVGLAEWCVRHNLLEQAERELQAAYDEDPRDRRLALLERRLSIARDRPRNTAEGRSVSPPRPSSAPQRADTLSGDVPAHVVERFTRRVQPVLVNNCTAAGCHQPGGAESFQVDRAILHGLANRRSTTQNLAAALKLVDRENPEASPLLTVPRRTHGGMQGPVFGPRHEQAFRHLVDWVALVAQSSSVKNETLAKDPSVLESPAMTEPETPSAEAADDAAPQGEIQAAVPAPQSMQYGARLKSWQPRDPFDAEIFNRRTAAQQAGAPRPE